MDFKTVANSVLDVDDTSRRVKVVLSRTEEKDLDKETIVKTAYDKTIKERGPLGAKLVWHLTDHNPSLKSAVNKFSELYMSGLDLVGVTDIPTTTWGNDVLQFYKLGSINQHSVGFSAEKRDEKDDSIIKEIKLYEGSAVLWGANPNTPTLTVGKSELEQAEAWDKTVKELNCLVKMFRSGHFSTETFELLELKIKLLTDTLTQLKSTPPAPKAVEPENAKDFNTFFTFKSQQNERVKLI